MDITGFPKKRRSVFAQNVNLLIGIDQKVNKCEKHFFSVAEIVRRAIDDYIRKQSRKGDL